MHRLLHDVRFVMENAGYRVQQADIVDDHLLFEDNSIVGVVFVRESVADILNSWEELQDRFLKVHGAALSIDSMKSWNCYTIYLTREYRGDVPRSVLSAIEEDFRGSRKIVGTGVEGKSDVQTSVASLLPLTTLRIQTRQDSVSVLRERLGPKDSPLQGIIGGADPRTIASLLLEAK